jgi:hypothetical protein
VQHPAGLLVNLRDLVQEADPLRILEEERKAEKYTKLIGFDPAHQAPALKPGLFLCLPIHQLRSVIYF